MPQPPARRPTRHTRRLLSAARHVRARAGGRCEFNVTGRPCGATSSGVARRADGTAYASCFRHLTAARLARFSD